MSTQTSAPADAVPHPLVVRTVALDALGDPGAATTADLLDPRDPLDLLGLLPSQAPLAWVRRGDGLVAWGETLRVAVTGPDRFADAARAWHDVLARAIVRDEVQAPGTGPVAFGSFAFDDDSPAGGVVVVPRVVIGRRAGRTWLTTLSTSPALIAAMPRATTSDSRGVARSRAPVVIVVSHERPPRRPTTTFGTTITPPAAEPSSNANDPNATGPVPGSWTSSRTIARARTSCQARSASATRSRCPAPARWRSARSRSTTGPPRAG